MSNYPVPEYDRPGYCCLCHVPIAEFDGLRIVKILSIVRAVYIRLNDGSMMQVTTCDKCKDNMTEQDIPKIMDSVYKGWTVEADKQVVDGKWNFAKREEYLSVYGDKHIIECDEKGFSQERLETVLGVENMVGAVKAQEIKEAKKLEEKNGTDK